jgi:hypothetical protein
VFEFEGHIRRAEDAATSLDVRFHRCLPSSPQRTMQAPEVISRVMQLHAPHVR